MDKIGRLGAMKGTFGLTFLISICSLLFWISVFKFDGRYLSVSLNSPFVLHLNSPQIFQFVTSALVHINLQHLLLNSIFLILFGRVLENLLGPIWILGIFFATSFVGDFAELRWGTSEFDFALGASGGIMGLMGVMLVLSPLFKLDIAFLGIGLSGRKISFIYFAAICVGLEAALATSYDGIAHLCHWGGLFSGVSLGLVFRFKSRVLSNFSSNEYKRSSAWGYL